MDCKVPTIESDLVERWAWEIYGLKTTATRLPGYVDTNFLLESLDGVKTVFKIAPDTGGRIELQGQSEILRHLEDSCIGSMVPRVITDLKGRSLSQWHDSSGHSYSLRMVSYLDGIPLAKSGQPTSALRREVGRTLGLLDFELMRFDHPGVHRKLVWDLARVLELQYLLELVAPKMRPTVEAGLRRFANNVQPRIGELRRSVIHNDANDYNILVQPDEQGFPQLSGLIDFGDAMSTITVAELAVASAYAMLGAEDSRTARDDVVGGFEEILPLEPLERTLLPDLIVGRLCASLLMSAKARIESPEDLYLTVSERPVSALLKRLS